MGFKNIVLELLQPEWMRKKTHTDRPGPDASENDNGRLIVLDTHSPNSGHSYQDTAIPFSDSAYRAKQDAIPEKLRQMRRLYRNERMSARDRAQCFYRQGMFMRDYEDDVPWTGSLVCYYPTYHEDDVPWTGSFVCYYPTYQDLTTNQLRGYFTWRKFIRKGDFTPIATSAAYLYVYELLNGIGTSSPQDGLVKLKEFEKGYLDSGIGDPGMRKNLRRWMLEYAIVQELPAETVKEYADPEIWQKDAALAILRQPENHTDDEVFSALSQYAGKKLPQSPVVTNEPDRGRHLFSEVWRTASVDCRVNGKDLFTACFGRRRKRPWYPLSNAVWYQKNRHRDYEVQLDECRSFICKDGAWSTNAFQDTSFDKNRFQGLLHEADLMLRRYLKTGRYLKEKPEDAWAAEYIGTVIDNDRKALMEATRPKITIDITDLERIREDSIKTRDSLLTEDEVFEPEENGKELSPENDNHEEISVPDVPLSPLEIRILRTLLMGDPADQLLHDNRLMPSIEADMINEKLFDEIGDIVLTCEEDKLFLVEDYKEDLAHLLGGI